MSLRSYGKEHLKGWFVWIAKLFFISFIQTLIFFLIIFVLERTGLFMMIVTNYNDKLIYGGEVGAFFFGLILISDIIEEILRYFVTERNHRNNNNNKNKKV